MARLPIPGQDQGTWGDILNEYLSQSLKSNGQLQDDIVTSSALAPNSVTNSAIAPNTITAAEIASDTINAAVIADGSITEVLLHADVQSKLNATAGTPEWDDITNKPVVIAAGATQADARTTIGAGTSNLVIGTTSTTAKAGDYAPTKADVGLGNADNTSDAAKLAASGTLSNKTIDTSNLIRLAAATTEFRGSPATKRARIDVSGVTDGNTRVLSIPDADTTLVGTDVAQTLTNKTISGPGLSGITSVSQGGTLGIYNTADQTTNYERVRQHWNSNVYYIQSEWGGTGTSTRPIEIRSGGQLRINNSGSNGLIQMTGGTTAASGIGLAISGSYSSTTMATGLSIAPSVNQTSTAGYTGLLINITETATGSGAKNLIVAQVGGSTRFSVDSTGLTTVATPTSGNHAATKDYVDTNSISASGTATLTNKTLTNPAISGSIYSTDNTRLVLFTNVASAVNYLEIGNAHAGASPWIEPRGSDANLNLDLATKGSGAVRIWTYAGNTPTLGVDGEDANLNLNLVAKGTGIVTVDGSPVVTQDSGVGKLVLDSIGGGVGSEDGADTWIKVATFSTGTAQWVDCNLILAVTTKAAYTHNSAIVSMFVRSNATGEDPSANIQILSMAGSGPFINPESFKIISGGWSTNIELWFQKGETYGGFNFYEISKAISGGTLTYSTNSAWQSATPTGTANNVVSTGVMIGGASPVTASSSQTLTNKTLTQPKIARIDDANGNAVLTTATTTNAVNYLEIVNNSATFTPRISAMGSDTNIGINLLPKGIARVMVNGVSIPTTSSADTLTNKRVTKRVGTTTSSATPSINTDSYDVYKITALATDITSVAVTGTPTDGQTLWVAITGTATRAIAWGSSFEASTIALPTATNSTNRLDVGFIWNTVTSKWRCVAVA